MSGLMLGREPVSMLERLSPYGPASIAKHRQRGGLWLIALPSGGTDTAYGDELTVEAACQHDDLDALFSEQVGWFSRCTDCLAEFDEDGELLR